MGRFQMFAITKDQKIDFQQQEIELLKVALRDTVRDKEIV